MFYPRVLALAILVLPWLALVGPAEAAKISITNCTDVKVKMCADENDSEVIKPDKVKKFSCKGECKFHLIECYGDNCGNCKDIVWDDKGGENVYKMEGQWSKGEYSLVGLETKNGDGGGKIYLASNLEEGGTCPLPFQPQTR